MAPRSMMPGLTLILLISACTGESNTTSPPLSTTTTVSLSSTFPPDLPGIHLGRAHRRRSLIVVLDGDGTELWTRRIDNSR